jgi:hypothetical protein
MSDIKTQDEAIALLSALFQQIKQLDQEEQTMLKPDTEMKTEDAEDRLQLLEEQLQERGLVQRTLKETLREAKFTKRYSFVLGVILGEKLAKDIQVKEHTKTVQELEMKVDEQKKVIEKWKGRAKDMDRVLEELEKEENEQERERGKRLEK